MDPSHCETLQSTEPTPPMVEPKTPRNLRVVASIHPVVAGIGVGTSLLSNHEAAGADVKIPLQVLVYPFPVPSRNPKVQFNEGEFPYGVRTSTAPL
jgi:hypothetical protein